MEAPRILLLTGVSGSGKTTIGHLLSQKLNWPFFDADDFHPAANIAKMSSGAPLEDEDRWPWLQNLKRKMEEELAAGNSAVFACSALRQTYRDFLTAGLPQVKLVYLRGSASLLSERLAARKGHFMREEMLASQLATLEEPNGAFTVDIDASPEAITTRIAEKFVGSDAGE